MTSYEESRQLDRALNAATEPAEMRELIGRRRLVRAALDFERAVADIAEDAPIGPIEPACLTIEEWRARGRL